MRQYKNEYGTVFAVRKKAGVPRLMCRVEEPRITETPRPMPGDVYRSVKSGNLYKIGELTNGKGTCYRTMRFNTNSCTWEPANSSIYPDMNNAKGEFEAWIRTEQLEPVAPTGAAAATTGGAAASAESAAETSITSGSAADANTSTPATSSQPAETSTLAPGSPAATAPAAPSPSGAETVSLGAEFDYSGLDNQTVNDLHLAEREYASGKRMAEMGLRRMADAVAIAHEALCSTVVAIRDNGRFAKKEDTFRDWCASIGITKDTAYRLLQVSDLFDRSTPSEQQLLEELSPSLLYAAAKPSAPPELVDAVKSGDITSHKQYQDLLTRYNAEHAAREQAEQERDEAATHIQAARDMQIDTARERDAARQEALAAGARAAKAEKAREEAEHIAEIARKRADRWQSTAEAAQNQPVAAVVDEDEVNRRAHKLADELTAPLREELESARAAAADPDQAELDARNAYDSIILASRTISNAWQSVKQQLAKIPLNQRSGAIDTFNKVLASIQSEAISCL